MTMYRTVVLAVLAVTVIHSYGAVQQLQIPMASELQQPDEDLLALIHELQRNVTDIWSYIHELRTAVSGHLTHIGEHQAELENNVHNLQHFHDGDSHSHGNLHGDSHHHSGEQHSHSGEHHSHSGEHHSHSGEHHSHSSEHGQYSHSDSHSHSHDHGKEDSGHSHHHEESDHHHDHKDSHENEDFSQQTQQVGEPPIPPPVPEPVVVATNRQEHYHHHHTQAGRSGSGYGGSFNLMNESSYHHHHHHDSSRRTMSRIVVLPRVSEYNVYDFAVCKVQANRAISAELQQDVEGQVVLWQKKSGGPLNFYVRLQGFNIDGHHGHDDAQQTLQQDDDHHGHTMPEVKHKHGFHVHTNGDLSNGCQSTGPHYNPKGVDHGKGLVRHVGDIGNIECDEHGITNIVFNDDVASLQGPYSIIGKSLVIHSDADDFGLGGNAESLRTGNAGTRIACCVIERVDRLSMKYYKAMKTATQYKTT